MLYPLNMPFPPDYFDGIHELQMQLLELACQKEKIKPDDIRENFSKEISDWLLETQNRITNLIGSLNTFAKSFDYETKKEIVNCFKNDYEYWMLLDNEEFNFKLVDNDYSNKLSKWSVGFFNQFCNGIDEKITRNQFINKKIWREQFHLKNRNLISCPFCDRPLVEGITAEHFLPKSLFPALSIHPANLIPCCGTCNSLKDNFNPVFDGKIANLPIPYKFFLLEYTDVCYSNDRSEFGFSISNVNQRVKNAIYILNKGYNLPKRWNQPASVDYISTLAISKLQQKVEADIDSGLDLKNEDFNDYLDRFLLFLKKHVGTENSLLLIHSWFVEVRKIDIKMIKKEVGFPGI